MITSKPQTGKVEIDLNGPDGNAFVMMGIAKNVHKTLNRNGLSPTDSEGEYKTSDEVQTEMQSGDYEHLVDTMELFYGDYIIMYR